MTLKPTNRALDVLRRRADEERRARDEALSAGGTQPEQVVRKLRQTVEQQGILLDQLVELFNRLPQNDGRQVDSSGWIVNSPPAAGDFTTVAVSSIPRPPSMNRVSVMAVGNVAAIIDNGGSSGALQGRIVINGVPSQTIEASSEFLGAQMRSVLNTGFFREITGLSGSVIVELQVRGRMSEFPASNRASLSVSVGFTRVG